MNDIVMRFKTEHGQTVDMTLNDLKEAYYEYRFLTKCDYIRANYSNIEDNQITQIVARAIELEDKYNYREDDAIEQAFDEVM